MCGNRPVNNGYVLRSVRLRYDRDTPVATFGSGYVLELVAHGLKFAGSFSVAQHFFDD
jgi:hypothetical protein